MAGIKEGDFVEVDFVGTLAETGEVVDTNRKDVAEKNGFHNPQARYEHVVAMIGAGQLMPGIEEGLKGKGPGTYNFQLPAEKAFGRKNPKLIQLIATQKFLKERIDPHPGLRVDVDGSVGIVRSVTGGRTIVDFNHPLAGKDMSYEVTVLRIITDEKEKLEAVVRKHLRMEDGEVEIEDGNAKVTIGQAIPPELGVALGQQIARMIPSLKKVDFVERENKGGSTQMHPEKKQEKKAHTSE